MKSFLQATSRLIAPLLGLALVIIAFASAECIVAYQEDAAEAEQELAFQEYAEDFFLEPYDNRETITDRRTAFLTPDNFQNVWIQTATVAMAALGMTLIIIAGGIDLSVGNAIALCVVCVALSLREGAFGFAEQVGIPADYHFTANAVFSVVLAVLVGIAAGLLNGMLIAVLRVVPFIVTLGTMSIFLGIATWLGSNTTVRPDLKTQVPEWIPMLVRSLPDPHYGTFPPGVWLVLILAVLLALLLYGTIFGRRVFALGSNEATVRLCGINVTRMKIWVYTLAGFFVGLAGVLQFARLKEGNPEEGQGMELDVIAAVVIGGGSLNGGRGSVIGTLAGAAIVTFVRNGCTMLELDQAVKHIFIGVIVIAAVTLDQLRSRGT